MIRYLPLALFAALAALFLFSLFNGDPQKLPTALSGKPVPRFSLPPIEGLEQQAGLSDSDLRQGVPVLLNVWASWCGPCRDEHDDLMALKAAGIKIYGLNYKDLPDAALRFLTTLGNPFEKVGADRDGRVAIDFGVYGVPETFLIGSDGRILARHAGPLDATFILDEIYPAMGLQPPAVPSTSGD
jgi:cytochrome c biogenesis protein CcmG/thiol:disulfide interchange protein DsbE